MNKPEKITIKNLNKRFGRVKAIDDVSLEIEAGSFTTLLGPSGCGKTTLLRCISGLEQPEDGEILLGSKMVFGRRGAVSLPPKKRNLGLVFQSYALWPHMTITENINFGLKIQKLTPAEIDKRVEEMLEIVGLSGYGSRYPSELSGGQQQRIALARMLAVSPNILLMDEPLSNLDAKLRIHLRAELKRIHKDTGLTIVYVTHDQVEAMSLSTHIAVMKDGQVLQYDSPDEIYNNPANTFVADFIGNPQMNLIPANIESRAGRTVVKGAGGSLQLTLPCQYHTAASSVILGFRPEDITLAEEDGEGINQASIHSLQKTGPEVILTLQDGENIFMARVDKNNAIDTTRKVRYLINPDSINLFSAEEETRLEQRRTSND